MTALPDILLHLDEWLQQIAKLHPFTAYVIFFVIVFSESAFFPTAIFLPGDGLLFAAGVLAADGAVHIGVSLIVLITAGVAGNWIAYKLGRWLGPAIFDRFPRLNRNHYQQAHLFYQRYGNKALIFSRFLPVVRALVPFVAGIALMNHRDFMKYNAISVALWVFLIVLVAFYLGHLPYIRQHFIWVIFGMAGISFLPLLIVGVRNVMQQRKK